MGLIRSCFPINVGLPRRKGGSAPALPVSRPAQRLLTLRPACLPSRLRDPLRQRLQRLRHLHHCSGCYRAERSSSRTGFAPAVDQRLSRRTFRCRLTVNRPKPQKLSPQGAHFDTRRFIIRPESVLVKLSAVFVCNRARQSSQGHIDDWHVTRPNAEESVPKKVLRGTPYNGGANSCA
jgi:hypothetical protein